ncbi:hypothetical protein CVO77_11885 [Sphingopyxis lindanitolerans]|uniref:Uncharacterized protein n=1 Tax=Sphingopyxis lindanitolerans TaxID=2054227 RepID=A0A2S8BAC4_9SPHN|nr:hypothetical protein CVO77_11885 [Sphingopyxis lindanitolerans]
MIEATHISKLLAGYRREPAANIEAVTGVLGALSAMAADLEKAATRQGCR